MNSESEVASKNETTLESRIVFIDTSIYYKLNYEFGKQEQLLCLQRLLKKKSIILLITDITKDEINFHLKNSYKSILLATDKLIEKEILLKATKEIDIINILKNKLTKKKEFASKKFEDLLKYPNCKTLKSMNIHAKNIFSLYFNKLPPFGEGKKKSEFPDAFVLEKIREYTIKKNEKVYIISADNDMKIYTDKYKDLIYLDKLKTYTDLVIRADDLQKKYIQHFADNTFENLKSKLISTAKKLLQKGKFIYNDLDKDCTIDKIIDIKVLDKKLLDISKKYALYEVELLCVFNCSYFEPDPDNMSKGSDIKELSYPSIIVNTHREKYSATLTINYNFKTQTIVKLSDFKFTDEYFILKEKNAKKFIVYNFVM